MSGDLPPALFARPGRWVLLRGESTEPPFDGAPGAAEPLADFVMAQPLTLQLQHLRRQEVLPDPAIDGALLQLTPPPARRHDAHPEKPRRRVHGPVGARDGLLESRAHALQVRLERPSRARDDTLGSGRSEPVQRYAVARAAPILSAGAMQLGKSSRARLRQHRVASLSSS